MEIHDVEKFFNGIPLPRVISLILISYFIMGGGFIFLSLILNAPLSIPEWFFIHTLTGLYILSFLFWFFGSFRRLNSRIEERIDNSKVYQELSKRYSSWMFGRKYFLGILAYLLIVFLGDVYSLPVFSEQIIFLKMRGILTDITSGILLWTLLIYALYLKDITKLDFKVDIYDSAETFQDFKEMISKVFVATTIGGILTVFTFLAMVTNPLDLGIRVFFGLTWIALSFIFGFWQLFWIHKVMAKGKKKRNDDICKKLREVMPSSIDEIDKDVDRDINFIALNSIQIRISRMREWPADIRTIMYLVNSIVLPIVFLFIEKLVSIFMVL